MPYVRKYTDDDVYKLQENEFALQFICNSYGDIRIIKDIYKKCKIDMRKEFIWITARIHSKGGATFEKPQRMCIVSLDELIKCRSWLIADYGSRNAEPKRFKSFNALGKVIHNVEMAIKVKAQKNDHFYFKE